MRTEETNGEALHTALAIETGITAFVGGGGKTSAIRLIAHALCASGSVLVTTSTHIFPPADMPVLHAPSVSDVRAKLAEANCICIGTPEASGKLAMPSIPFSTLRTLFDYVLVEADGAKGLPLKAPAAHEPVLPEGTDAVVAVAGLDAIRQPIADAAFRPALYAKALGKDISHVITPADVAVVLCSASGQYKGVCAPMRFSVLLNKADDASRVRLAHAVASALDQSRVEHAVITSCKGAKPC